MREVFWGIRQKGGRGTRFCVTSKLACCGNGERLGYTYLDYT